MDGQPVGEPGNEQGTFNWPGTGQMYSSARDLAVFLAANLGALPDNRPLQDAMALAQQGVFTVNPRFTQALGWQVVRNDDLTIVDKNGGLNNTSTYVGMIPQKRLGIVILANRGKEPATRIGRQIMLALARSNVTARDDGPSDASCCRILASRSRSSGPGSRPSSSARMARACW